MGLSIGGLKKWFDGAANDVQGAYHQVNPFDGGRTFSTNAQGQQPFHPIANPQQPQRNFFERSFDQVNPFDAGRTFKQALPTQDDASVIHQLTHNGLTNTVGNLTVKPIYSTGAFGVDAAKMGFDHLTGAPLQTQVNDANAMASRWHQSVPGFLADQGINAGKTIAALPRAIQGDVMGGSLLPQMQDHGFGHVVNQAGFLATNPVGFAMDKAGAHPHAPTQEQQQAYNHGLQALNQTVVGQMVSPAEAAYGDLGGQDARQALQAGGYNMDRTGAAKYFADPVMGAVGTYGLLKGGEQVVNKGRDVMVTQPRATAQNAIVANLLEQARQNGRPVPRDPSVPVETPVTSAPRPVEPAAAAAGVRVQEPQPAQPVTIGGKNVEPSQPGFPSEPRTKGFIQTILDDPQAPPALKAGIDDLNKTYMTRNTDALQMKAANFVKDNPDAAMRIAKGDKGDISVALGNELISKFNKEGNIEGSIDMAKHLADTGLDLGRGVQAFAAYGRLTPEGILRFAQREIQKYNELTGRENGKKGMFGSDKSPVTLSSETGKKLVQMSEEIQKLPEGSVERGEMTARLIAEVQKTMPATLAEKLGTAQTMAQLLNIKTNVRNILGNGMFGALDNVSQALGAGVDTVISKMFGTDRTTTLPDLKVQGKNFIEGGKTGIREAKEGINTGPSSQFDLNSVPVFRTGILNTLERTMNGTLRGADRAAYEAAFNDTIHGLQKLQKTDKVTPEMLEQAHHTALYRTFQDSNAVSDFFVGMKKSLNKVGIGVEGKRFGLGDIVLKYPKTPGNLLARGIDYSPAGFIKATFEMSKPLFGHEFNQKAFVDSFSRATVGTGTAFGMGYLLADNGIITAAPSQNKDLRNVQKTAGLGGYQINASALKRWVASGFNKDAAKLRPNDTLVSYDWAQPAAIPLSAGAALGAHAPVKVGAANTASNLANSANTLVEQPLLQGVQRLFGGYGGIGDAAINTGTSAPASFVPTAISQLNQLFDNHSRIMTDNNPIQSAINQVKAKVPGAAQTLPTQYDVLGNPKERYQDGGNNPFNVMVNPAFVSKYKPTPAANEVLDLYQRTGETKQTPNTAPTSVKITGSDGKPQTVKLTGSQQSQYQQLTGQLTAQTINQLAADPNYMSLPDSEKVKILSAKQTDINNAAKVKIMGDNPDSLSAGTADILGGGNSGSVKLSASKANIQVAVQKFTNSDEKTKMIGDNYYFKTKDGTVKSMPKVEYDFNVTNSKLNLGMDRAQAADDIGTWMKLAEQQYNALEKKKSLYDPGTESDKIDAIQLQQENLMQKVEKYQEYGGFKKGGNGKGVKKGSLPSIDVSIPSGLSSPVVQLSSYKAPALQLKNKGSVRVAARKRGSVKLRAPSKI